MPRKRRQAKLRTVPAGLAEISLCERAEWSAHGPALRSLEIVDDSGTLRPSAWPDVATWATFYGSVRDELFASRPSLRERSVAEAMFEAWSRGDDPEAARETILAGRRDPREVLNAS